MHQIEIAGHPYFICIRVALSSVAPDINRGHECDKLELLNFQLNVGNKDHVTKPVLLNTLCWPRTEVVAIPDKLWENLSTEEKSSARKQKSSKEGKTFGKIYLIRRY